jgi:hypothetical protein
MQDTERLSPSRAFAIRRHGLLDRFLRIARLSRSNSPNA